jgi:hypothetical protein
MHARFTALHADELELPARDDMPRAAVFGGCPDQAVAGQLPDALAE